jgi:hypothetical protein
MLFLLISPALCHAQDFTWNVGQTYNVTVGANVLWGWTGSMISKFLSTDDDITSEFPPPDYNPVPAPILTWVSVTQASVTLSVEVAPGVPTETAYLTIVSWCDFYQGGACPQSMEYPNYVWSRETFTVQIVNCNPTITSLLPRTWFAGESYPITITGTGFNPTAVPGTPGCPVTPVTAKTAKGSVGLSNVTVVSPTQITATVAPDADDPTEVAEITVGSSSHGGAVSVRTQILAQPPTITSISPSTIYVGKNDVQVTISGSRFGKSPTVNLPTGVTSSGQTSSETMITMTVSVGYVTPTTSASVTVTNNDNSLTSSPSTIILNGPAWGAVQTDDISLNLEGTVIRTTTYQVYNVDNSTAGSIPIAEDFTSTDWNCHQCTAWSKDNICIGSSPTLASQPARQTDACDGIAQTDSNGQFSDQWSA